MSRFTRMQTLNAMYETGMIPVFYHSDVEVAINVAQAIVQGGGRLFELTNRGDAAFEVFHELEKHCAKKLPQLITGAGSIVESATASLYINLGANFVVGPLLNPEVARTCNRRKIPYSPGCGTISEISQAEELGCEIVKIFPAIEAGGPSFVQSVRGPCPWVSIMPTRGVEPTEESLTKWFKAGVACVGMGSSLITQELVAAKDYAGIRRQVEQTLALIRKVRSR